MKEAPIHARAIEQSHGPRVAIGQDRLGTVFLRDMLEARGNFIQRLIPTDALEASFALCAGTPLGVQQALRRILAFQVARHFAAKKPASDGMRRVTLQFRVPCRLPQ